MSDAPKVHRFEAAGLGKAPFRVVGVEYRTGPITYPNGLQVGAPGQPMGACHYCGQGIAECWLIRSADGKEFDVGCECVRKTGDAGLRRAMAPHLKAKRDEAAKRRIAAAHTATDRPEVWAALAMRPSPIPYRAERGETLVSHVVWMLHHAGTAGKLRACREVERVAKEVAS